MKTTFMGLALFCVSLAPAMGQAGPQGTENTSGEKGLFGVQTQKLAYLDAKGTPTLPTQSLTEILPGNGTRAGYTLSHGGIVPTSIHISAGAKMMRANVDYYLDAGSGALFFADPVSRFTSIRVTYNYVEGQDANRSAMSGLGTLALNMKGTALQFGYGVSKTAGLDFNTYGLNMNSKLNANSALSGMVYFSSLAGSSNNLVSNNQRNLASATATANSAEAVNDHLIVQNLNMKSGGATFRATYQDIGAHFNGFQSLRQSAGSDAAAAAQVALLEKEKGIHRLGFGTGLALSKTSNLGLDWDQIDDGTGSIVKQSLGFASGGLNLKYSTQAISSGFAQFGHLREAEAGQWAREKGLNRSDLALGFNAGKGGAFSFGQSSIGDASGSLNMQSLGFTGKTLNIAFARRDAASSFARLNDLSDAEKSALALDIRRQFNPDAQANEVTAKDKEQIGRDAGLSRNRMAIASSLGKQGTLGFSQFSIGDGNGAISRQTLNLATGNLKFNFLSQNISSTFGRLGGMSDFERSQFANETGVHRTAMGLAMTLNKATTLGFSQLNVGDSEGGMSRQAFDLAGKGFGLHLKLSDTASSFTRARDLAGLSDAERNGVEAERGYSRTDLGLNLALTKTSSLTFGQLSMGSSADHLSRQSIAYAAKGLDLKANFADTSAGFDRAGTLLGLTDVERQNVSSERGYSRSEYSANITSFRGLQISSYLYDANNRTESLGRSAFRHSLAWAMNKTTQFNLLTEGNMDSQRGADLNGRHHDLLTLNMQPARGMKLNLLRDSLDTTTNGAGQLTTTDFMHFETDGSKANKLVAESKRISYGNGHFENTTSVDSNYRLSTGMLLQFTKLTVDRGNDASSDTNAVRWNWQASKAMAVTGSFVTTGTNNHADTSSQNIAVEGMLTKTLKFNTGFTQVSSQDENQTATLHTVGISGALSKDLNFSGSYSERTAKGQMALGMSDFALSNAKPMNLLGLTQVVFSAKMAAADDRAKNQNSQNAGAEIKGFVGKNQFALGYGGVLDVKGGQALARSFSFTTDTNEKLPFHCNLLYKARNINGGTIQLVRKYDLSLRVSKTDSLTYSYTSLPEDQGGNMQQVSSAVLAFHHALSNSLNVALDYTSQQDLAKYTNVKKLGALIKSSFNKLNSIEVGYNVDINSGTGNNTDSQSFRVAYSHKVDDAHFLTLASSYTGYHAGGSSDLRTDVNFKTIF